MIEEEKNKLIPDILYSIKIAMCDLGWLVEITYENSNVQDGCHIHGKTDCDF